MADDEIRSLWPALESPETPEPFRNIVRVLLADRAAPRRNRTDAGRGDRRRHAGNSCGTVQNRHSERRPLTKEARQWIGDRKAGFMFSTTDGKKAFSGYSKAKRQLDAVIAEAAQGGEAEAYA